MVSHRIQLGLRRKDLLLEVYYITLITARVEMGGPFIGGV